MVEARNLKKIYNTGGGRIKALDGIDLTIGDGEFLAIMGSSGSGKSTLLHLIAGVDTPTSGSVWIDGVDIHRLKPSELAVLRRRSIGMIYQTYNLVPTLTVEENMILPLMLDRRPIEKEKVDTLLEVLQLKDRRRHLPGQLSGGQQQRTAIGRVLLARPSVLLADEPTGNLDTVSAKKIMDNFTEINGRKKKAVVVVTHDPVVASYARRILFIKDGKIMKQMENHPKQQENIRAISDAMLDL